MTRSRDVATRGGLTRIIPSSIQISGGSASVTADGKINFSGINSLSVYDAFNSTYQNYLLLITLTGGNAHDPLMQLGGQTNNYYWRKNQNGTITDAVSGSWNFMRQAPDGASARVEIFKPTTASHKQGIAQFCDSQNYRGDSFLSLPYNDNYTSLNIAFSATTGNLKIYGYNNG